MNKKIKTAVFVSGGGTNLQALIDAVAEGKMPHCYLTLVVSTKADAYALKRAEKAGIKSVTVEKSKCNGQSDFEEKIVAALEADGIEFIILAGFMSILSADFIKKFPNRIINVHPSLIPAFCGKGYYGLRVHDAVLKYGVKYSGATVHFVNEVPDGGKIIFQRPVKILDTDTPESLQRRIMERAEWKLLPKAAETVCKNLIACKDLNNK